MRQDKAVAQVPGEVPEGVVCRVLLESAVPHWRRRRGVRWDCQALGGRWDQNVRGARPEGSPQGGGGQPCWEGSLVGCAAIPRVRVPQRFFFP